MNTRFLFKKRRRNERSLSADGNVVKKCKVVLETVKAKERSMNGGGGSETEQIKSSLFHPNELQKALLPTLDAINAMKLSKSSRSQLSTIKHKLSCGKYSDAREYVEDVWSVFENICLSDPNGEHTELADAFELEVNAVMEALGYCCGKNYRFDPQELRCVLQEEKEECTISIDAFYFTHQKRYNICENCFTDAPGDTVTIDGESSSETRIRKEQFKRVQNNVSTPEPFIDCQDCGRRQHKICVLYSENIWPDGFVCERCLASNGAKRTENRFNAKNLPVTRLDRHIEARVNNFLKQNKVDGGQVVIRVLLNIDETVAVKPAMRSLFVESGELSAVFPYRSKAIFAFQEIDGVDVCIFGFFVQEYGSECPSPNTRRVYITFLDSVNFFQPRNYRTAIYHEILLGYMDFAKQLGYIWLHIWASPPPLGENYIFYKHPTYQKIPDRSRLLKWYTTVLRKGVSEGIIVEFRNILLQSQKDKISTAATLPYFDGDYWPDFFEETIQKMDAKSRTFRSKGRPKRNCKGRLKQQSDRFATMRINRQKVVLSSKLLSTMAKVKTQFFSVRLHSDETAATLGPIKDPDRIINHETMNSHNAFFEFARDNCYEFSSLRRAQFSTMCILFELHVPETRIDYICNICKSEMETWFHCRVCEDYDLCVECIEKNGHAHEMHRMEPELVAQPSAKPTVKVAASKKQTSSSGIIEIDSYTSDDEAPPSDLPPNVESPDQTHPLIIESFTHACQCLEVNCGETLCPVMRDFTSHVKFCQKIKGACNMCEKFNKLLLAHLDNCRNANCSYSFCRNSKAHIQQQQKERHHNDFRLNIATSLQKLALNILESTDPQVILNVAYETARVQVELQNWIAFNGNIAAQLRNVRTTDSKVEDQSAKTQASRFLETKCSAQN